MEGENNATADSVASEALSSEFSSMPENVSGDGDAGSSDGEEQGNSLFDGAPTGDQAKADAGDTGETAKDEPELIAGRFKTQEDLLQAWEHQNEIIKGRVNDLPDDELKEIAKEKGFINEPPEKYENSAEMMAEHGIEPFPDDAPEWEGFYNDIREAGFTQSQMETMFKIGGPWVQAQIAKLGPEVNVEDQQNELREEWGDAYEANEKAITAYATANIPSDLLYKPLGKTALGHKLLKTLMDKAKGGAPITKTDRVVTTGDPAKLDDEISEIMKSDAYQNKNSPDYTATNAKVDKMLKDLEAIRKAK